MNQYDSSDEPTGVAALRCGRLSGLENNAELRIVADLRR